DGCRRVRQFHATGWGRGLRQDGKCTGARRGHEKMVRRPVTEKSLLSNQAPLPVPEYVCGAGATVPVNWVDRVMQLDSPKNRGQVAGVRCRQSPLRGLVGALVVCAFLIGLVLLLRHRGVPWFAWGGCAVLAALLVPLMIADALAKFRSTNWVLWLR